MTRRINGRLLALEQAAKPKLLRISEVISLNSAFHELTEDEWGIPGETSPPGAYMAGGVMHICGQIGTELNFDPGMTGVGTLNSAYACAKLSNPPRGLFIPRYAGPPYWLSGLDSNCSGVVMGSPTEAWTINEFGMPVLNFSYPLA